MVTNTLDHIAAGGIVDHLAGGFHRYSTDRRWHVPHFEKMLYDQAQLAEFFAQVYHRTGKQEYRRTAERAFAFVLKEMSDPAGGFISSLDAQTDGVEGVYYVWTPTEVDAVLGRGTESSFGGPSASTSPRNSRRDSCCGGRRLPKRSVTICTLRRKPSKPD